MKEHENSKWTISDVFDSQSDFWLFDDSEIEDYYFESFMLKHKKKIAFFDYLLVFSFIVFVLMDYLG